MQAAETDRRPDRTGGGSGALEAEHRHRPTFKPAPAPAPAPRRGPRPPRNSRLPPALVLSLRVALTLAALAVPAIFLQNSDRRSDPLVAAVVTLECVRVVGRVGGRETSERVFAAPPLPFRSLSLSSPSSLSPSTSDFLSQQRQQTAALVPLTMWTPLVGSVCLQAAYVLPAVAAGGGLATAAWYAVGKESRTALAAAAGVLAAGAAAWGAATAGMSQVGGVAAAVAVVVAFLGFNFERPVPPHLVLAVSLVGLAGGSLAFLAATWLVAPEWASDACLRRAGEGVDALVRMVEADGGGGWRLGDGDGEEEEEHGGEGGSSRGLGGEDEEDEDASSPSTFLGASGEPSTPRIPPRLKRLFQKKIKKRSSSSSNGRRRRRAEADAEAKGTTATATKARDEEAPPLPPTTRTMLAKAKTDHRAPAPGYNRPAPLAGGETLPGAGRAWVELSSALAAAEALLGPAAGEAFWGLVSLPSLLSPSRRRARARVRVLTPALPPPLWPLRLRELSGAHVVPLRAGVEELAAALRASARLSWTMRSLSASPPLSPGGPVSRAAREVYLVPPRGEEAGGGGGEAVGGGGGGGGGGSSGGGRGAVAREGARRDLLAEWQSALEAATAAAAHAVPRSYAPLLPASSSSASDPGSDTDAVPAAGDSPSSSSSSLASALAALRRAAEALDLARERAGAGAGAATIALLLSRAAEDEGGSFAEEARFGTWEGGVVHAVANAERVGRAVEALRGMMPK